MGGPVIACVQTMPVIIPMSSASGVRSAGDQFRRGSRPSGDTEDLGAGESLDCANLIASRSSSVLLKYCQGAS